MTNPIRKIRALFSRRRLETEMAEEMRLHVQQRTEENAGSGISLVAAGQAASREFGNSSVLAEECREARSGAVGHQVQMLAQDLRFASRQLARRPGFAIAAVGILAIGMGAATAVSTAVEALFFRSLPVRDPGSLVMGWQSSGDTIFTHPDFQRFQGRVKSLQDLAAVEGFSSRRWLRTGGDTVPISTQWASGNLFPTLGVLPAIGRTLLPSDDRNDAAVTAAFISYDLWQRQFGGSPTVIGRVVRVGEADVAVVGVAPRHFQGVQIGVDVDMWLPMQLVSRLPDGGGLPNRLEAEGWDWLFLVGRLEPGVPLAQASVEFEAIFRAHLIELADARPADTATQRQAALNQHVRFEPAGNGFSSLRDRFRLPLRVLAGASALLLLVSCANVAGLLVARGLARERELSVRASLGAGRSRLVRQLLTESAVLAAAGALAGWWLSRLGVAVLAGSLPPRAGAIDLRPDAMIFLGVVVIASLSVLTFGLVPAWRLSRAASVHGRVAVAGGRRRLGPALVVVQVAVSAALLVGAGLFARTLSNLASADLGYDRSDVLTFSLEVQRTVSAAERADISSHVLEALQARYGVGSLSVANGGLLTGESFGSRFHFGAGSPSPDVVNRALFLFVGAQFFNALGIPVVRGAMPADPAGWTPPGNAAPDKAAVNEAFVRRFLPDVDPIGQVIRVGLGEGTPYTIVAVVRDTKYRDVREQIQPQYYLPHSSITNFPRNFYFRTSLPLPVFQAILGDVVRSIDPGVVVSQIRSIADVAADTFLPERMMARLVGFFGVAALALACIGTYSVLSLGVELRRREIGVRMALGATWQRVGGATAAQGLKLVGIGLAGGLVLGFFSSRLTAGLFYNVAPSDPLTLAAVAAALLAVALVACAIPALRAARIDPMVALRSDA